jgi:DNA polymerase-3 subunit gamma/tau
LRALGLSGEATLEEMAGLIQQLAVLQSVPDAADADDPDAAALAELAGRFAADETQLLYSIVLHGRAELALAPDEYSGMVMVLLRWLAFAPTSAAAGAPAATDARPAPVRSPAPLGAGAAAARPSPVRETSAQPAAMPAAPALCVPVPPPRPSSEPPPWLDAEEMDAASAPAPEPVRTRALPPPSIAAAAPMPEPVAAAPRDPADMARGDRWAELVCRLVAAGSIGALVRELAWQAQCIGIDEAASPQVWQLRVEREVLRNPAHADKLQAAVADLLGMPVRLDVQPGPARDTPAERDAVAKARRQAMAEQTIQEDPLVRSLMAQYTTARIVPGSIKPH